MIDDAFIDAAFAATGQDGWRSLRASRLIDAAFARADRALIGEDDPSAQPIRDRLFDLIMRHLESLAPLRPGFKALLNPRLGDPVAALCAGRSLRCSIRAILTALGISPDGPIGALRGVGLTAVYLSAFRVFLDDPGADLGATMAELDRRLTQIEPWAERLEQRQFMLHCKKVR